MTRTQSSGKKSTQVNALPKVVGSAQVLQFPPTGKKLRIGLARKIECLMKRITGKIISF